MHSVTKILHNTARSAKRLAELPEKIDFEPFLRIKDGVHFARKDEATMLQLADMCVYVIKRRLMNDPLVFPFYDALSPIMVQHPAAALLEAQSS